MTSSKKSLSRRSFLTTAAALTGGLALSPRAFAGRRPQANDMLDVAVVGVGGRGVSNIGELLATGAVNIVALCDCDERQAAESFAKLPNAKRYSDWRKLLDAEKTIDASDLALARPAKTPQEAVRLIREGMRSG